MQSTVSMFHCFCISCELSTVSVLTQYCFVERVDRRQLFDETSVCEHANYEVNILFRNHTKYNHHTVNTIVLLDVSFRYFKFIRKI